MHAPLCHAKKTCAPFGLHLLELANAASSLVCQKLTAFSSLTRCKSDSRCLCLLPRTPSWSNAAVYPMLKHAILPCFCSCCMWWCFVICLRVCVCAFRDWKGAQCLCSWGLAGCSGFVFLGTGRVLSSLVTQLVEAAVFTEYWDLRMYHHVQCQVRARMDHDGVS